MFEAVNAEVDSPGKLQEHRALNMKKKLDAEGLEKRAIDVKVNEKSNVCFLMGITAHNWFRHTEMINLFYQNLTLPLGVNSSLDMFSWKNILHVLSFSFRF